ncbi:MAG TPA: AraC family transcriptional regulator [Ktedonobacteraceae bacterium]
MDKSNEDINAVKAELENGGLFGQPYSEALSQALVLHFLRHYASLPVQITSHARRLSQQQICRVHDYIHDHMEQGISLADMASTLGVSISYFTRLFKEATGLSPHQYVIQCRVEFAKHLLLGSQMSIAEVALRAGFSDQSHLYRHLKRCMGITPKDLRHQ